MGLKVCLLAGGTGGAKLARGLYQVCGSDLSIIANTGDDIEIYQSYVSPDPDLIAFRLAGIIDERGWGIKGDTFTVMQQLRELGQEIWFNLGDRDLAICLDRKQKLERGHALTAVTAELTQALNIQAQILPMTDDRVQTEVELNNQWLSFQEYMIKYQASSAVSNVRFAGADQAAPTNAVLEAIRQADLIIIGPSNPVASIEPILSVPGISEALTTAAASVIAVSPIVDGKVLKGPTETFMRLKGLKADTAGIATYYEKIIDGLVCDQAVSHTEIKSYLTDLAMPDLAEETRLAKESIDFALSLTQL